MNHRNRTLDSIVSERIRSLVQWYEGKLELMTEYRKS